jgi:UDP-N-acetylglucosamine 2-epimerase (non-hydrolysing)
MNRACCIVLPRGHIRFLVHLPYQDSLALQKHTGVVITDSVGIQKETTFQGAPCLTERPVTTTIGTKVLVGRDSAHLASELARVLSQ